MNVQLGADYRLSSDLSVGLYSALSFGEYDTVGLSSGDKIYGNFSIAHQEMHEWLQFGLRALGDL